MTARPDWATYFMRLAKLAATRSTCLRVTEGVGAVLVKDNRVIATGYAGSLPGAPHCIDVGCHIDNGGCVRTVHAEQNAIAQAAMSGCSVVGSQCYTTLSPCLACLKLLIASGVREIYYAKEYRIVEPQRTWAKELKVVLLHQPVD